MRIYRFGVMLLLASALRVSAQVTVEVKLEQEQFLPGESLPVAVRITNRSGQTLHLGAEPDWLTFSIDSRQGGVVPKIGEAPVQGEFDLASSKVATKRLDLAPFFSSMGPGRYGIVATLHVRSWNRDLNSLPTHFDVIEGSKLWEQEVGVPRGASSPNADPEVRKYILQQANYLKGHLRLSLRVTDSYGKTYRVVPIGNMVSFSHPIPQVDKFSNLHVLYQDGPTTFSYTVCNLLGEVLTRQTYDYVDSRPRLRVDDDGIIGVVGGARRITANDIPAPKDEDFDDDTAKPAPANSPDPAKEVSSAKP